eukprot:10217907-Alexandrium_andersonii.AAC.1
MCIRDRSSHCRAAAWPWEAQGAGAGCDARCARWRGSRRPCARKVERRERAPRPPAAGRYLRAPEAVASARQGRGRGRRAWQP